MLDRKRSRSYAYLNATDSRKIMRSGALAIPNGRTSNAANDGSWLVAVVALRDGSRSVGAKRLRQKDKGLLSRSWFHDLIT